MYRSLRPLFCAPVLFSFATSSFLSGAVAPDPVEQKAMATIDQNLESKNPDWRKQAAVALSLAATNDKMEGQLVRLLNEDKDVEVRLAAIASLSDIHDKTAKDALVKAMDDAVPEISFAAAKALWSQKDPAGRGALISVLQGESKTSSGLFTSKKREALRMMHTPRTAFFMVVKEGVGFVPVPGLGEGVASMQSLLSDPNLSGRASAALLLSSDTSEPTMAALKDALHDKTWSVRAAAAHALALHNDPKLKGDIAPLIDDQNEAVKLRAAAGYLRLRAIESRLQAKPAAPKAAPKTGVKKG
jgi:HEAT repeat protein